MLVEEWLAARARAAPAAPALYVDGHMWRYQELDELVGRAAARLAAHVKPAERVGMLLPNGLAAVCLVHAVARVNAILVPLNTRLTPRELARQIAQADCSALVFDSHLAGKVQELPAPMAHLIPGETLLAPGAGYELLAGHMINLESVQSILYTSGTSGQPKGAQLTFGNHFFSAAASAFRLGSLPADCWLCCLPLYHVGGMAILLRSCLYGTAVDLHARFDVEVIAERLASDEISLVSLVPTMLHRLLQFRSAEPWSPALRHVLLGGAAASADLLGACRDLGLPLSLTYGLTEAASQVATMSAPDVFRKPGSVGRPLMFTRVAILDPAGQQVPSGEVGEIVVAGPTVMRGYDRDPHATRKALRRGWLHTGDVGYVDQEGDLWVLQRREDVIITGGENVYPREVETVVRRHPAVAEVCVLGIPDSEWGQRVVAVVVAAPAQEVSAAELRDFCRQQLAGYKVPSVVHFVHDLPKTSSGKIRRSAVAALVT